MLKRPIFQEDITIINAYASDIRSSKSGKVKMTEMRNGLMRNAAKKMQRGKNETVMDEKDEKIWA